jgi:hypothetical protein
MRVVVTRIGPDGTMRRRVVDAASSDPVLWERGEFMAAAGEAAVDAGQGHRAGGQGDMRTHIQDMCSLELVSYM